MDRTINGKTIKEIFELLRADLPQEDIQTRDYDNVVYISADAFRERLNSVVGPEHYNETYADVQVVQAKESLVAKTICTIELLDDNFEPFLKKQSAGGSNIIFPNMDKKDDAGNVIKDAANKPVKVPMSTSASIPNDFDGACQDAFKRTCKKGFLIGKQQLERAKEGTPYIITISRTAYTSNGGHKFLTGVTEDGKTFNIAVFKNKVSDFDQAFPIIKVNSVICIYGKEKTDKQGNPQIVFEKVGKENRTEAKTEKQNAQHEANCSNQKLTLEVIFENKINERNCQKGDYSTTVLDKKNNVKCNLVFLNNDIEKLGLEKWKKLIDMTVNNEKPTAFIDVERGAEGKNEVYYVKGFSNKAS